MTSIEILGMKECYSIPDGSKDIIRVSVDKHEREPKQHRVMTAAMGKDQHLLWQNQTSTFTRTINRNSHKTGGSLWVLWTVYRRFQISSINTVVRSIIVIILLIISISEAGRYMLAPHVGTTDPMAATKRTCSREWHGDKTNAVQKSQGQ